MKLIFVRHGDADGDSLTKLGHIQAKNICHELKYENIDNVFVSPMHRTIKTAEIICKNIKIKNIYIDSRLSEREKFDVNVLDEEKCEFNANYLNPNYSHKNPEGCKQYKDRIFDFLNDIKSKNADKTVLIVGHSSMIYVILAYVYGFNSQGNITWARFGNCSKICFENL